MRNFIKRTLPAILFGIAIILSFLELGIGYVIVALVVVSFVLSTYVLATEQLKEFKLTEMIFGFSALYINFFVLRVIGGYEAIGFFIFAAALSYSISELQSKN